jgi:hypothetical protein
MAVGPEATSAHQQAARQRRKPHKCAQALPRLAECPAGQVPDGSAKGADRSCVNAGFRGPPAGMDRAAVRWQRRSAGRRFTCRFSAP